jgi:hypothetical protein
MDSIESLFGCVVLLSPNASAYTNLRSIYSSFRLYFLGKKRPMTPMNLFVVFFDYCLLVQINHHHHLFFKFFPRFSKSTSSCPCASQGCRHRRRHCLESKLFGFIAHEASH